MIYSKFFNGNFFIKGNERGDIFLYFRPLDNDVEINIITIFAEEKAEFYRERLSNYHKRILSSKFNFCSKLGDSNFINDSKDYGYINSILCIKKYANKLQKEKNVLIEINEHLQHKINALENQIGELLVR